MVARSRAARRVAVASFAASLSFIAGTPAAGAQTFGLDPSFAGGKVVIDVGAKDVGSALAIQPDGSMVVAGTVQRPGGYPDMLVARLRPDGGLDPAFGTGGRVLLAGAGSPNGTGLAVQPDGQVLVSGLRTIRLMANGQLDPSWGAGAPVTGGVALALQPDGRVVVTQVTAAHVDVARLNADGSSDQSFGVSGRTLARFVAEDVIGGYDMIQALALTADGSIVVAGLTGYATSNGAGTARFALLRLTPGGQMDPGFGTGGRVVTDMPAGRTGYLQDIAILGDGRIVAAGTAATTPTAGTVVALARYRSDGALDSTFGAGGLVFAEAPPVVDPRNGGVFSGSGGAAAVTVDAAGRLVVAGSMMGLGSSDIAVVRFSAAGMVDTTFNGGGWVRTDTSGESDGASAVAIQADGRIVVAGTSDASRAGDVVVARYVDGDPAGQLEGLTVAAATRVASVSGWVADADATSPVSVRVHVDGAVRSTVVADRARPDVARADARGFGADVALGGGSHSVCAYAVNQGAGADTLLGCKSAIVAADPFGSLDTVGRRPGGVLVAGWGMDPDVAGPVAVYVYVDGTFHQALTANQSRPDVGGAYPGTGTNHGYSGVVPVAAGTHNVCAFVLNQGPGAHQLLGCKNVWVTFDPIGSLDVGMTMGGQVGVGVYGWAIDQDVAGPVTVNVYVDGVFLGALLANQTRLDVEPVIPGYGANHGFEAFMTGPPSGFHTICAFAINQAAGSNTLLGCIRG